MSKNPCPFACDTFQNLDSKCLPCAAGKCREARQARDAAWAVLDAARDAADAAAAAVCAARKAFDTACADFEDTRAALAVSGARP